MAQIFNSFISGMDVGTQQREQRSRRDALEEAGRLYAANDAQGAENALMGAGLVNEAGAYSALNEARRGRRTREAVSGAMTNLDPGASPTDRLNAGATAALGEGDTDQWFAFQQAASQMSAQQREEAGQRAQWIGSAAASLLDVPVEQRVERAQALLASSPYANDQHVAQMIDEAGELSDEALNAAAHNSMGAADILAGRERQERYAVQDRQQERSFNLQERGLAIQARNSAPDNQRPLPPGALATARSSMAAATRLRTSYNSFLEMLRNASPQALAGIGPEGAALQSAHRLLAIQAKSPAALDLGALVGADFNILNDILGEPGNIRQLVQSGGRDGALRRLEPFDQFLDAGAEGLRQTYQPWAAQMPEFYQDAATPTADATTPAAAPTAPNGGGGRNAPAAPAVGTVVDGFRFRGGDPNNQNNWVDTRSEQPGGYRGR